MRAFAPRRLGELSARGVPLRALLLSSIGIATHLVFRRRRVASGGACFDVMERDA